MAKDKQVSPQVKILMEEVQARAKEIKDISNASWKTSCSYDKINLHVESDMAVLVGLLAQFSVVKESAGKLIQELGLNIKGAKLNGYYVQEWIDDVQLRIQKLNLKEKKTKLENLEKRLESILSPEERREIELQKVIAELGEI